jgi:hypothetical protein
MELKKATGIANDGSRAVLLQPNVRRCWNSPRCIFATKKLVADEIVHLR